MAVTYGFFNSVNGDRKYNADQMSEYFRGIVSQGVFQHLDSGMAVSAGTGLSVSVAAGRAIIQNRWVQNSAALNLTISDASETYGRKDAVVIRLDKSSRAISIAVKTGTPAASPVAPSMTRGETTYEMALAYVNVAAGASSVTVTDKRSDSSVCGWASVAQATSGEVDQQLNDMKTGFDGVTYDSPAAMVRANDGRLADLVNQLSIPSTTPTLEFYQEGINGTTGAFYPETVQIRTGFIFVGKGNSIFVETTSNYRAHVRWYNGEDTSTFVSSQNSVSGNLVAPTDYVAFALTAPNWGPLVPSEGSHLLLTINSQLQPEYGACRTAYILSSGIISFDTRSWKLTIPSENYCRVITSFGEKFNLQSLGEIQLSQSCVVYYDKKTNTIISKDYTTPIYTSDLYLIGVVNSAKVVNFNILSLFSINGVISVSNAPEYTAFSTYLFEPAYISILGDSISTYDGYSEGSYYPTGDVDDVSEMWWSIVCAGLRTKPSDITVSAISRTSYVDQENPSLPPAYDDARIARLGSNHYPSYVFVNMGTNDPYIGILGDMTYESDITALNALPNSSTKGIALTIRKIQNSYAGSRIVLLIPKPVDYAAVHSSAPGYSSEFVDKLAQRIEALGKLYGVYKVIDLRKCDMNQNNIASYCGDGAIHPNANGMNRIGKYILHELLK